MLNSRADVLMEISKVVNSQKPYVLHNQTGEGRKSPVVFSKEPQDGTAAASQA